MEGDAPSSPGLWYGLGGVGTPCALVWVEPQLAEAGMEKDKENEKDERALRGVQGGAGRPRHAGLGAT